MRRTARNEATLSWRISFSSFSLSPPLTHSLRLRFASLARSSQTVKVFNKGGSAWAAQWDAISEAWVLIGEVTGTDENRGKIDGVEFDHVLPIEHEVAGGGVRTLKIGYNNGEVRGAGGEKRSDDELGTLLSNRNLTRTGPSRSRSARNHTEPVRGRAEIHRRAPNGPERLGPDRGLHHQENRS